MKGYTVALEYGTIFGEKRNGPHWAVKKKTPLGCKEPSQTMRRKERVKKADDHT